MEKEIIDITKEMGLVESDFKPKKNIFDIESYTELIEPYIDLGGKFIILSVNDFRLSLLVNDKEVEHLGWIFLPNSISTRYMLLDAEKLGLDAIRKISLVLSIDNKDYLIYENKLKYNYAKIGFATHITIHEDHLVNGFTMNGITQFPAKYINNDKFEELVEDPASLQKNKFYLIPNNNKDNDTVKLSASIIKKNNQYELQFAGIIHKSNVKEDALHEFNIMMVNNTSDEDFILITKEIEPEEMINDKKTIDFKYNINIEAKLD